MLVSLQCCYSLYVVAGILAVTDVPSVVVFPYVPDVSILQYCRRQICCFSVVAGFPAASGISAVANVLRWRGRRLCCCFQYGVCTIHCTVSTV